jgi:3'(2'), 5'-bisphosphate nucleotidase
MEAPPPAPSAPPARSLAPRLDDELALATELARAAGRAILEVKADAIASSSMKSDESPVTKADLAADAVIRAGLAGYAARGDALVTEETWASAGVVPGTGRAWFIDPIDGTEDFIAGRPDYVVQIGLCIDGEPVLGVLYQPETGVTWRGVVGALCERIAPDGTVQLRGVGERALAAKPRVAVSLSHPSAVVDFIVGQLGGVAVGKGSVGLKVGLIVDDEADAYVTASRRIKVWDTCAPAAVLLAAGGVVETLDAKPVAFHGPAAHPDGVVMWTARARAALKARVDEAVARFREQERSR